MIAFNDGYEPQSSSKMSKSELLSPASLIEIIKYLMFTEDNDSIQVIIDKELDGYHLALTVDKKENK